MGITKRVSELICQANQKRKILQIFQLLDLEMLLDRQDQLYQNFKNK